MSLTKSWYRVEQAAAKYGLSVAKIDEWVALGLVRTEDADGEKLVNSDDIEQELHLVPSV